MLAQKVYDFAQEGGCSGQDAHEFFNEVVGKPSPSGYVEIPKAAAVSLMELSLQAQAWNSPSLTDWCKEMTVKYGVRFIPRQPAN